MLLCNAKCRTISTVSFGGRLRCPLAPRVLATHRTLGVRINQMFRGSLLRLVFALCACLPLVTLSWAAHINTHAPTKSKSQKISESAHTRRRSYQCAGICGRRRARLPRSRRTLAKEGLMPRFERAALMEKFRGMIARGEIETITIGKRRLVVIESYVKLVKARRAAPPEDARRNTAVPALGSRKRGDPPAVTAPAG